MFYTKNMIKTFLITFLAIFLFTGAVHAQETDLPDPGILPGHPLYFLKNWSENIRTVFTFSDEAKAERMLFLSEKRLAEANELSELGEVELAQETLSRYEGHLNAALERAQEAREKGQDMDEVLGRVSEATSKHQGVLADVYERVPEQAQEAIQRAMEQSKRGQEEAIEAISSEQERERVMENVRERMVEVEQKMQEMRNRGINIPEVEMPDMQDAMERIPETPDIDVDEIMENLPNVQRGRP